MSQCRPNLVKAVAKNKIRFGSRPGCDVPTKRGITEYFNTGDHSGSSSNKTTKLCQTSTNGGWYDTVFLIPCSFRPRGLQKVARHSLSVARYSRQDPHKPLLQFQIKLFCYPNNFVRLKWACHIKKYFLDSVASDTYWHFGHSPIASHFNKWKTF
jgi:hypothetical protein